MLTEHKQISEPKNVQFLYWFDLILNNLDNILKFTIKIKYFSPYPPIYNKNKYSYYAFF